MRAMPKPAVPECSRRVVDAGGEGYILALYPTQNGHSRITL